MSVLLQLQYTSEFGYKTKEESFSCSIRKKHRIYRIFENDFKQLLIQKQQLSFISYQKVLIDAIKHRINKLKLLRIHLQIEIYRMGCCASISPKQEIKPVRAVEPKPAASKDVIVKMATAPQFPNRDLKTDPIQEPLETHNNSKILELDQAQQDNQNPLHINNSGRPGWNVQQDQQKQKSDIKAVQQSPINVIYSSDAKQQLHGLKSINETENNHQQYNVTNPITQMPSSMEVDKISAFNSQTIVKHEDHFINPDSIKPKVDNNNEAEVVQVQANIENQILLLDPKSKLSDVVKVSKVQGQEQTLQSFNQSFAIPIFEVGLTIHQ